MTRLLPVIALIFFLLLGFSSCLNDKADLMSDTCDTTYYAREIRPIFETNCAISGCHVNGGAGSGDFTMFEVIHTKALLIRFRINLPVTDQYHMPLDDSLPDDQIIKLTNWIDEGAVGCQ